MFFFLGGGMEPEVISFPQKTEMREGHWTEGLSMASEDTHPGLDQSPAMPFTVSMLCFQSYGLSLPLLDTPTLVHLIDNVGWPHFLLCLLPGCTLKVSKFSEHVYIQFSVHLFSFQNKQCSGAETLLNATKNSCCEAFIYL